MSANNAGAPVLTTVATNAAPTYVEGSRHALSTDLSGSLRVTIIGGGAGGTSMTDDSAFTVGTTGITPAAGIYRSVRDAVTDNDAGAFAMTEKRAILACLETPNADSAMDDTNDAVRVNVVAGGAGSALQDKTGFTEGTTNFTVGGGVYNETIAGDPSEDQGSAFRITAKRGLHTNIRNASGTELAVLANPVRVDPTGTTAQPVTDNGSTLSVDDGGGALTVDGTVTTANQHTADFDSGGGTDTKNATGIIVAGAGGAVVITGDAGNGLDVDVTRVSGNVTVVNGGTFATQVDGAALTALQLIDDAVRSEDEASGDAHKGIVMLARRTDTPVNTSGTDLDYEVPQMSAGRLWTSSVVTSLPASTNTIEVVGDAAHDAGVSGNPVLVAGAAQDMDDTAPPNRVSAEADTTRLATCRDGTLFVHPHGPQVWSYHLDTSSAQTDTSVHAAPGAGLSLYVTDIVFSSGAATAINLFFEEGASKVLGPYYLEAVAGRGMALHFQTPKKITANTALTLTTSAAIAHCVDVTGFVAQG